MAAGYSREQGDGVRKDGWTGNGRLDVPTARQAKRADPDLEAGPEASAERSEGTMEARMGRDAAGGSMHSTTARPDARIALSRYQRADSAMIFRLLKNPSWFNMPLGA